MLSRDYKCIFFWLLILCPYGTEEFGVEHKTQLKIPNGIQYTRATQRCLIEILLPGQKKNGCIKGRCNHA